MYDLSPLTREAYAQRDTADACGRAPSGSLFPANVIAWTATGQSCRDCGRPLTYTKRGTFEHREELRFSRITSGPYASEGRYSVHRAGDRKLRGVNLDGTRWSRLPYYGHVVRGELHGVRGWRAMAPGGRYVAIFPTRREAGLHLLRHQQGC